MFVIFNVSVPIFAINIVVSFRFEYSPTLTSPKLIDCVLNVSFGCPKANVNPSDKYNRALTRAIENEDDSMIEILLNDSRTILDNDIKEELKKYERSKLR